LAVLGGSDDWRSVGCGCLAVYALVLEAAFSPFFFLAGYFMNLVLRLLNFFLHVTLQKW
jgi:hypothetical protein